MNKYQKLKIIDTDENVKIEIDGKEIKNIKEYQIKRDASNNDLVEVTLVIVTSPDIEINRLA